METPSLLEDDAPHPTQIRIWRGMTTGQKGELLFQLYQMVLEAVRASERALHPEADADELAWRVARRMSGVETLERKGPWEVLPPPDDPS